jgi:hypothetical protein
MLNDYEKNYLIEDVFIIGGIKDQDYQKLNDSLSILRSDHSTILPIQKTVSLERFTMFVKKIKYHNLCINMIESSTTVDDITKSTWISDVLIVCDRSHNPPVVTICKYRCLQKNLKKKIIFPKSFFSTMINNYKSHFSRDRILDRYSTRCIYRGAIFSLFDKEMKENLSKMYHKSVSTSTISCHLHEYGYKNVLPQSTHINIG